MFSKTLSFSKSRPIFSLMIGLVFVLFGVMSVRELVFVRLKTNAYPGIAIRTEANGFDANKVEDEITGPLERIIAQVGGVRRMTSISEDGTSLIQVQMEENLDLKFKSLEFREKIDTILGLFPREVHKPLVYRYDPTNAPLMVISFSKDQMSQDELREYVEKSFKRKLEAVEGVSQVIVAGGKVREILIACDAKQLEAYSLSLRDIVNKLQDINQNDSLGKIRETSEELTVQVREKFQQMILIRDLPIKVDAFGRIVHLRDIATVSDSPRDDHVGARLNAKEKVSVFIYKNDSSDPTQISKSVRNILKSKSDTSIQSEFTQDESLMLEETIYAIIQLTIIIFFFILLYLLLHDSILPFALTYIGSFLCVLFSLVLLYRVLRVNVSLAGAYGVLFGSVVWLLIRIREIRFKNGEIHYRKKYQTSKLFLYFIISVGISLILSQTIFLFYFTFTLNMVVCFYLFDFFFPVWQENVTKKIPIHTLPIPPTIRTYHSRISHFLLEKGKAYLNKTEKPILSHPWLLPCSILFLTVASLYTLLTVDFYENIQSDTKETVAILEFPSGTAYEHTSSITLRIEKKLLEVTGVKQVVSKIDPAHSLLLITLEEGVSPDREFLQTLKLGVGDTEDGFLFFASDLDSSYFQEIVFDVVGYDQKELESITQNLTEKVKNLDGVSESVLRYKQSREELQLLPKFESLVASGINIPLFGDELRLALQGGVATKMLNKEKEIDVRVRFSEKYRNSKSDFHNIRIKSTNGRFIPIAELVQTKEDKIPMKYYHKNRSRSLSFAVKLEGNSSRMRKGVVEFVKTFPLPEGYHIEIEGEDEEEFLKSVENLFFFFYPIFFVMIVFLLEEKQKTKIPFLLIPPYYLCFFLWQFFFPGPFYLPFQIGMLAAAPLILFFLNQKFNQTSYLLYLFVFLDFVFLILIDSSVISFFSIWTCVLLYLLLATFLLRLLSEWRKVNGESLEKFLVLKFKSIR